MGASPSKKFNPEKDIPDLKGKVIIVTGGNAGIGYSTVKHLARRGAKVYLAARNESKATGAIATLQAEGLGPGNGEIVWLKFDLSDPRLAKQAAEDFISRETRLDVLINNAGRAVVTGPFTKSNDGISDSMMVNHFGPFVFTQTLLPLLVENTKRPGADIRIINVSSDGHRLVSKIPFNSLDDINIQYSSSLLPAFMRYCVSKLAGLLWASELQRRLDSDDIPIIVISVHPGAVDTFTKDWNFPLNGVARWFIRLIFVLPDEGAYTSVIAAASPTVRSNPEQYKGAYLVPIGKITEPSKVGQDLELAHELWETTEKILDDIGLNI